MDDIAQNHNAIIDLKECLIHSCLPLDITVNLAIEALEKQIPKKPIQNRWAIAKCPCCGAELGQWLEDGYHKDYTNLKVCDCGQKLDWSGEDE